MSVFDLGGYRRRNTLARVREAIAEMEVMKQNSLEGTPARKLVSGILRRLRVNEAILAAAKSHSDPRRD